MTVVNISDAKARLSKLISESVAGVMRRLLDTRVFVWAVPANR